MIELIGTYIKRAASHIAVKRALFDHNKILNILRGISIVFIMFIPLRHTGCSDAYSSVILDTSEKCSIPNQNRMIYQLMSKYYLWYDKLTRDIDFDQYDSPQEFLDAIMCKDDKFSYIKDQKAYDDYYEGRLYGLGYGTIKDIDGNIRISYVYPDSPADLAGMKRGQIIREINGVSVDDIDLEEAWEEIHGVDRPGIPVTFLLENNDGTSELVLANKDRIKTRAVLKSRIIIQNNKKIGYLAFKSFIRTSTEELDMIFSEFKLQGVDELVLDLRYNRGGLLSISAYLASLIAGGNAEGEIFVKLIHNDKNRDLDSMYIFQNLPFTLDLARVIVITTGATSSASEALINGLMPFINVVTIGSNTRGKIAGMETWDFCGKMLIPITYKMYNANNMGIYYDGFPPQCPARDDMTRDFGDIDEHSLEEALHYIEYNSCLEDTPEEDDLKKLILKDVTEIGYKLFNSL